jgi:hypothetical protein
MGMQEDLAEVVRLIESVDGKEGMVLEKMHILSQAGLFIRTHHADIQRNAEDAARYRWLRNEKACTVDFSELRWLADEEFDESIDAAMRSANGMESV